MKWHAYALYVKKVACEIWIFEIKSLPLHRKDKKAQMAESVDALVSNTSGVTSIPVRPGLKHQWSNIHPGSTPGLGTSKSAKQLEASLADFFCFAIFEDSIR